MNSPYMIASDLIELTPADPETVRQIRWQIDRHLRNENDRNRARKAAQDANTYQRRRTDGEAA